LVEGVVVFTYIYDGGVRKEDLLGIVAFQNN
jgi:hypothetical protein